MKVKSEILIREITLNIPSEFRHIYLLDLVLAYIAKEMDFDEETKEQVNLAVIEAGTNAIKHGNKNDPSKAVRFRFDLSDDRLEIFIKDCGSGFKPDEIGDPLSPENFMKPCGRGIFLMKALMDEVDFVVSNDCGTEVKLIKHKTNNLCDDVNI